MEKELQELVVKIEETEKIMKERWVYNIALILNSLAREANNKDYVNAIDDMKKQIGIKGTLYELYC